MRHAGTATRPHPARTGIRGKKYGRPDDMVCYWRREERTRQEFRRNGGSSHVQKNKHKHGTCSIGRKGAQYGREFCKLETVDYRRVP